MTVACFCQCSAVVKFAVHGTLPLTYFPASIGVTRVARCEVHHILLDFRVSQLPMILLQPHRVRILFGYKKEGRHDNRHTYASHLVSSGLSLEIVGRLLGHTTATTTKRYAHLADDPLRAATGRFGTKFASYRTHEVFSPDTPQIEGSEVRNRP